MHRLLSILKAVPMFVACLMMGGSASLAIAYVVLRCALGYSPYESPLIEIKGGALFLVVFAITPWLAGISFNFPTWTKANWFKWEWSRWDGNTRLMGVYGICVLLFCLAVTADIALP